MEKIVKMIKEAKSAVVLSHISADGDAVASCAAMAVMLRELGIPFEVYFEEPIDERFKFIAGDVKVYDGNVIDYDTAIVLDCGDVARLGKRAKLLEGKTVINIDHHKTNPMFGDAQLVMEDASATGEVLFLLSEVLGTKMNYELARCLYSAICSDTGCFAYSNVSPKTFMIASELIKYDINHAEIARLLFDCVDIKSELIKAELVKSIHSHCDGKIRTVAITKEMAKGFGVGVEDIQGLVEMPRRIRGTEIAVALKERDDSIRISLRANGDCDVAEAAMKFGGGGHTKAAGCTIDATIEEAERLIVKACEELL